MEDEAQFEEFYAAERLVQQIWWLVELRWMIGVGMIGYAIGGCWILGILTRCWPTLSLGVLILGVNLGVRHAWNKTLRHRDMVESGKLARRFAVIQIIFDMVCVAVAAQQSGGILSPLFVLYLFHILLAAALFSRKAGLAFSLVGLFLFAGVTVLDLLFPIHVHLAGLVGEQTHQDPLVIGSALVLFAAAMVVSALLGGHIGHMLSRREEALCLISCAIGDQSVELDRANQRLVEMDKMRIQQVRHVSHELRSPLSTIRNCLMVADRAKIEHPKAADMVQRALRRVKGLLDFINDLLALARVESGKFTNEEVETVDLGETVHRIGESLLGRAEEKSIKMTLSVGEGLPTIQAAPQYVEQLITNLITNAVKYTPEGGHIETTCQLNEGRLRLEVADSGIGMSEEQLAHLFEEFFRTAEAKKMDPNGTGLGMALVKQVVDRYNGTIEVKSKPGEGSRFIVHLPVNVA